MAAPAFGFSAGDFAAAVTVLYHVIRAFDSLEGARRQYTDTQAFLRGLKLVFEYLDRNKDNLSDEVEFQSETVCRAYEKLHKYLETYAGFNSKEPKKIEVAISTIKWSFNELNGKVQKVKETAMDAVAVLETMVVLELRDRIGELRLSSHAHTDALDIATTKLDEVRSLTASLTKVSEDNSRQLESMLANGQDQTNDMKQIQENIKDMEARISESQKDLAESLAQLNRQIEEQRAAAADADLAAWDQLQDEVHEEAQAVQNLEISQKAVQGGLQDSQKLLGSMGTLTNNRDLQVAGQKAGALNDLVGVLGGFGGIFGRSKKSETPQPAARMRPTPRPTARPTPTRTYASPTSRPVTTRPPRSAPPMPLAPPPRRISPAQSPLSPPRAGLRQPSPTNIRTSSMSPRSSIQRTSRPHVIPARDDEVPPSLPPRPALPARPMTELTLPTAAKKTPPPLPARPGSLSPALTAKSTPPQSPSRSPVILASSSLTTTATTTSFSSGAPKTKLRPALPPRPTTISAPAQPIELQSLDKQGSPSPVRGRAAPAKHARHDSGPGSDSPKRTVADGVEREERELTFAEKRRQIEERLRGM